MAWLIIIGSYLAGSVLPAEILVRRKLGKGVREIDPAENPGVAGSWRLLGPTASIVVLFFNLSKGAIPVLLGQFLKIDLIPLMLVAAAPVVGHSWSAFYRGQGGRGLATSLGALLALAFEPFLTGIALAVIPAFFCRWVPAIGVIGLPLGLLLLIIQGAELVVLMPALSVLAVVVARQLPWISRKFVLH